MVLAKVARNIAAVVIVYGYEIKWYSVCVVLCFFFLHDSVL